MPGYCEEEILSPKKIIILLLLITPGVLQAEGNREFSRVEDFREEFAGRPLLSVSPPGENVIDYFRFYDVEIPGITHYFGTFSSRGRRIAAHLYLPPGTEETVYLIHGLFLHSASYSHLIRRLVAEGYGVAAFDLPGHGFSSGPRVYIRDFQDYADVLHDFIREAEKVMPPPRGVIGLSTGCSVILEYCRHYPSPFPRHVLGAPLVRSDKWGLSRLGNRLIGGFVKSVPTLQRDTTSDKEIREFIQKTDPLKARDVPLAWVKALYRWHDDLHRDIRPIPGHFLILQGDKDIIVQWKYNIPFLKKKLINPDIRIIPGGKHELYLEEENLRNQVIGQILQYLKEQE